MGTRIRSRFIIFSLMSHLFHGKKILLLGGENSVLMAEERRTLGCDYETRN